MLNYLQHLLARLRRDEAGQGLVEYALIIVLVSIACVLLLGLMGNELNSVFSTITSAVAAA
jgi:pilus assembly protein Flp/PilA